MAMPENEVKDKYMIESRLQIFISKGNLIHQKTDAIVCPANSQLKHEGGAAKTVADAAGEMLVRDCKEYIDKYTELDVTMAMHTTAGDMRPNVKYVIHSVGVYAKKKKIDEKQSKKLLFDMIQTFLNCYNYANDVLKISSIAVPAIGSGLFGVPIEIVGSAMFEAAQIFEKELKNKVLTEIHFVNFDDETVNNVLKAFYIWNKENTFNVNASTSNDDEDKKKLQQKDENQDNTCAICMDEATSPEKLKCGHIFCKDCLAYYNNKCNHKCPTCGMIYGMIKGNQPFGRMQVKQRKQIHLAGYESYGTLEINYSFNNGFQNENHPKPGHPYYGTHRNAYLPDNEEGREVANMLKKAFDNKLVFTIGRSLTSGHDDCIIWNDIHHKTSLQGGAYGFPDPTYLKRVTDELASKGIYPENKSGN